MKFVLVIYHGPAAPLPGSDRWKTLSEAEQKAIYEDYAEINKTAGITPGPPLGLASAAKTVRVLDGEVEVKNGPHLTEGMGGSRSTPIWRREPRAGFLSTWQLVRTNPRDARAARHVAHD